MLPRIAYISEESEDLDRRYAKRRTLFLPTEPPDVPWGRRAILLDLSETGLRMQCHAPPEVGEEFTVELPMAGPVTARIIWQNDLECGAEFTEAISRAAVSAAVEAFGGQPWLLRFFDQIRFYPVSAEELLKIRRDFPLGRYPLKIEETELRLSDYQDFLVKEAEGIEAFRSQQRAAFDAERQRWIESGQAHFDSEEVAPELGDDAPLGAGQHSIESHIAGNLWQVSVNEGDTVKAGDVLVILESMKMEIPLLAPRDGVVREVRVQPGSPVRAGQRVVVLEEA